MDAFSKMGEFLSSSGGQGILKAGTAGTGFLQNLLAARQANAKQKYVEDLLKNPAKFQALVKGAEQPLTQGLTTDIARQTDAYGAERGLGSSPAIMKDVYAQALAPYQQQEQQMAINSVLQRLGVYADQPTMKPVDVSSIFKFLAMGNNPSSSGVPIADRGVSVLQPSYMPGSGPDVPAPDVAGASFMLPDVWADTASTLPAGGDF